MNNSDTASRGTDQWLKRIVGLVLICGLAACASSGGYYQNDGPGSRAADEFVDAPDAIPRDEPIVKVSTRPYTVFGRRYEPFKQRQPLVQQGAASWYGKQFHGRPTSIGETYDMYAMTAAHPTLPLPSYVRITNQVNQRSVVVRVNDRGPFLNERIVDLSFAAAAKLGYTDAGTANVVLEVVDPMVVTLQAVRQRVGLPPLDSSETLASIDRSSEAAAPLKSAATLPLTTAQPQSTLSARATEQSDASSTAQGSTEPIASTDSDSSALPPIQTAATSVRDSAKLGPTQALPQTVNATEPLTDRSRVGAIEPESVEAVTVSERANRRIADVMIPPDIQSSNVTAGFTPPPVIVVEPFEGQGLRRAIPESERERRERARKARNKLASKSRSKSKEPVFVVPYKDRLPKVQGKPKPPKVYLQLGSYDTEKSAQVALVEASTSLRWMRQPVQLINDRGLHKIQAGPFASARTAKKAAKRIRLGTSFSPFYVYR